MALSLPLYSIDDLRTISAVKAAPIIEGQWDANDEEDASETARASSGDAMETDRIIDDDGNRYQLAARENQLVDGWMIIGCEAVGERLAVPERWEKGPITAIGAGALRGLGGVVEITLPNSITSIGSNAFVDCEQLRRIVFPANLDRFDTYWLRGCSALTDLTLPGRLRHLRQGLLEYCPIESLAIGEGLETIDLGFFKNSRIERITVSPENPSLITDGAIIYSRDGATLIAAAVRRRSVVVAEGCETIARKAFFYDDALETIELPQTLRTIEGYAFAHSSLTALTTPPHLASIGAKAFFRARALTRIALNEGLRAIGDEAFAQTGLRALAIPASVVELGKRVVASTDIVVCGPDATLTIDPANEVYRLADDGTLYAAGDGATTLIEMLDGAARRVSVRPGTTMIGYRAFVRHASIETVELPEGLRIIGESAFRGCTHLKSVALPESLERIEAEAFLDTRVATLGIPRSLEAIGRIALITRGGNRAVRPPSLKAVTVDPANPRFYMGSGILCERTRSGNARAIVYVGPESDVDIPREVVDIEDYAFAGVTGLTSLRLHRDIRHLGTSAFVLGGPVPLIEIELPEPLAVEAERPWLSIDVPPTYGGARTLTLATTDGRINAPFLRRLVDNVILTLSDAGERARYTLPRLADPVFLDPTYESHFRRFVMRSLDRIVCRFARMAYWDGFESLFDLGFLNDATITGAIDAVSDAGEVEATSYLLDMKRRRLGAQTLDFGL